MGKAQFVLTALGIKSLQVQNFVLSSEQQEETNISSYFGTPIFDNLEILDGSYKDLDGNNISYNGLRIDTVLIDVSQTKNIITTAIQGCNGTIKEYISDGDFIISVKGLIMNNYANAYPELDVKTFYEICKVPYQITVISNFLQILGISSVVITDYKLPQTEGVRNYQVFELSMLSDTPVELEEFTI